MARPLPKLLLIINPEGTLVRTKYQEVMTLKETSSTKCMEKRPNIEEFLRFLFIRNKLFFKVGVWTSLSISETEAISRETFSSFEKSLLFKYASPNQNEPRDLQRAWHNFPEFSQANTIYIDTTDTSLIQKDNILAFPPFQQDECLKYFPDYLKFFSFNYQRKKNANLLDFMKRINFKDFFRERSMPEAKEPKGESSRFW
ncbi:hypothetical protein SteCoe_30779 [Stentor coeruleus]|uniref:FCP1 homology domain-containing protein n=1 Tax=Stentor coeruleus TaxID=5963 RepID=A0A1R2B2T9_9CILI|nr:hypothetical protein SteCoe_30779 [Stentor coeruleus]